MEQFYHNYRIFLRVKNPAGNWIEFQQEQSVDYTETRFRVPFSDTPERNIAEFQLFNLSESSIQHIQKGCEAVLRVGYKEATCVEIFRGEILNVDPKAENGSDVVLRFTAAEGIDYFEKKEKSEKREGMTFGVNSSASTALREIAANAGIDLQIKTLKTDYVFRSGYTTSSDPRRSIEDIAKLCETPFYYDRGKLVVHDIKSSQNASIVINRDTGLISQPSYKETNEEQRSWSVETLLLNNCFTGSKIELRSNNVSGTFFVKSGEHNYDGSRFISRLEVY